MHLIVPTMKFRTSGYKYSDFLNADSVTINRWDDERVTIKLNGPTCGLKETELSMPFQLLKAIYYRSEALEVEDTSTAVLHLR